MIYDIWEITDNNRCQISRLEAKDFDECIKMVLDYYVKPEFHKDASEDYIDDDLMWASVIEMTKHRGGHQHIPVPIGIGQFYFIEDLTYDELKIAKKHLNNFL